MLTKKTFRDLLKKLLDKSSKDLVNWQPVRDGSACREPMSTTTTPPMTTTTPPPLSSYRGTLNTWSYIVEFEDGGRIRVEFESPAAAPDQANAVLIVDNRTVLELEAESGDESGDFELLNSLVLEAGRHAEGWDKAVQKIEQQLDSNEMVGTVSTPSHSR